MNQHIIARIAVYLLSIVMIVFGVNHFIHPQNMVGYVPSFIPGGIIWVYFVGAAFILAALAFLTHRWVRVAGYLLAVLLFMIVLTIHLPNFLNSGDADMRQMALISLLKDTAIAAFALHIASTADSQGVIV